MRKAGLAMAAGILILGPWLAFLNTPVVVPTAATVVEDGTANSGDGVGGQVAGVGGPRFAPIRRVPTGCTCREIVVNASNKVRDADIRSGDAEVVNRSITFVAPTYGDDDVEVEQEAVARTGDAIAGQIIGVDASGGGGCSRVVVNATNDVEDVDVRSGDATARNESVILLDPRVNRGDLDIDVDQEAEAKTGVALAGQVIGVQGGGGPCGGVIVDAANRVRDADIRTGEATIENLSDILTCRDEGCLEEIRELLSEVDSVRVCAGDECESVAVDEFVAMLEEGIDDAPPAATPRPGAPTEDEVEAEKAAEDAEEDEADEEDDDEAVDHDEGRPNPTPRKIAPHLRPPERDASTANATPTPSPAPA